MSLADKFELWLLASYVYYDCYDQIMPDYEWDMLGRELTEKWDEWEHKDKHLVKKDEMFTGFDIVYPKYIRERYVQDD